MNLVLDVGNTSIKAGFFEGKQLLHDELVQPENLPQWIKKHHPEHILVSDVRGITEHHLKTLSHQFPIIFLNHHTPLPIHNRYQTPETLGTDRLAGVIGAYFSAPDQNHLVLDAGTCLTYDFIDKSGNYWGGNISMGLQMRFQALAHFTGKLPEIQYRNQHTPIVGQTTEEAILSGVIHGLLGEVHHILENYRQQYGDFRLTICGGDTDFFEKRIKASIFANQKLVLFGLNEILWHHLKDSKKPS